jgi:hypothetical protein
MKLPFLALSFSVLILQLSSAEELPKNSAGRIVQSINSNWTFNYFPSEKSGSGYESPTFDDSKWRAISLPHTWNTYETMGMTSPETDDYYWQSGWGWYRKHFRIDPVYSGKKFFLEFEGVRSYCKVWINGKLLGEHMGGYGKFDFDITSLLKNNSDNVIAVSVSNKNQQPSYKSYGGIHRNVTLVIKNPLFIPMQGSASHEGGTFITTSDVSRSQGSVSVQTWVKNDYPSPRVCILQTTIKDKTGKIVQSLKTTEEIKPGETYRFNQDLKAVKAPHIWSPSTPYLYKVTSELFDGKSLSDSFESSFGFRWYEQKNDGLYVNGEKMMLHEWDAPDDYPFIGSIISEGLYKQILKEYETNVSEHLLIKAVTMPDYVYDLTDEDGIITGEEIPVNIGENNISLNHQITEVIRSDRNHPSVLFWILGDGSTKESFDIIRKEDPGRIVISKDGIKDFGSRKIPSSVTTGNAVEANVRPAGIRLSSETIRIVADRGSVARIDVSITGPDGRRLEGLNPVLKWVVLGPAKLVGPAVFNSDDENLRVSEKFNFIRSTGEPGEIIVRAYAAGLPSGELRITAYEETLVNNGIIQPSIPYEEKKLSNVTQETIPGEIRPISKDLDFSNNKDYRNVIRKFIMEDNSSIDTSSSEFRMLTTVLDSYLRISSGKITADDYNFNTSHYNMSIRISKYIQATKLPASFKAGLREYYSSYIIAKGNEKDAEEEMNWLNWIPSGGTVIYYVREKDPYPEDGLVSQNNDLASLIAEVHPVFSKFSDDAKTRAIEFITRMNPYVHRKDAPEKGKEAVSTAEEGKPVLIPLLKYISE